MFSQVGFAQIQTTTDSYFANTHEDLLVFFFRPVIMLDSSVLYY